MGRSDLQNFWNKRKPLKNIWLMNAGATPLRVVPGKLLLRNRATPLRVVPGKLLLRNRPTPNWESL